MMKQCFKCGACKELDEFYKHPQMADGHLNKCKECTKRDVNKNRADNHEYYLVYDRIRYDIQGFRGVQQSQEKRNQINKAWSNRNKKKKQANVKVNRAIASGLLVKQPCSICGSEYDVKAHHENYNEPLNVTWLCTYHHGLTRRKSRQLT